ncbi:hypothetical protein J3Q64DRAFT_1698260 [Phycomyces blakesleeanus]|uniref:Uncharacterized protein n=2 Tax=Phycomyces blakesleeanus TaxID=4837 RepID=A0A167N990_PHYB8|nr:hypothetical protein PHYBLDRAFT_64311 [Phycomyces blakesleeanus NRRL 1555(-)]OAD75390.1 hypothetical protein PHYBLDRAFT_64311 [Phycomyces blakesleeanus NRRL 1555(-)]|eukprot:XP_018293430.1 hypothetical protein PHYBLDRAFT_64311 [Phycomyces blakesleeanus NRRL 1555(-)]
MEGVTQALGAAVSYYSILFGSNGISGLYINAPMHRITVPLGCSICQYFFIPLFLYPLAEIVSWKLFFFAVVYGSQIAVCDGTLNNKPLYPETLNAKMYLLV